MGRGKTSAFNANRSTMRKKANGVNAPLSQLEWVCFKVETLQGPCEDITLHRRGMFVCFWKKSPSCPPGLAVPTGGSPSSDRTLLPLLTSQPVLAAVFFFCDHRHCLLSFPGPWKQCDSLPEGWDLERLLSSLQGDAGPVRTAHAAQQPPEAAVHRRLRNRFVSIGL